MEIAALVTWVLTTVVGAYLFTVRVIAEGLRRSPIKITRYPTVLALGHPVLGVAALGAWVEYLVTSRAVYAWSAFAGLVLVALLGFVLLTRWLIGRGGKHARDTGHPPSYGVMLVHGVVAIVTFVLVLLAAITRDRR